MVKIAEWWSEPTTPDQCGENPAVYTIIYMIILNISSADGLNMNIYVHVLIHVSITGTLQMALNLGSGKPSSFLHTGTDCMYM